MSLFAELKRRNVLRVVIAYLAGAWLLIQIADVLWPIYDLPESALQLLINVIAIGLIPAIILAWVFEWTPKGLRRDAEVAPGESITRRSGRVLDRVIIVVLALAVTFFAIDEIVFDSGIDPAALDGKSIAVLPFVNMSADPDQVYFSDGISKEILNLLVKVRQLRVISRSSAFRYRDDVHIPTVAEELNVSHVLEGSVRMDGSKVRITAQLIDARTDTHVWSDTWDRELIDIFTIQDEIAAMVVRRLEVELLGQSLQSRRTDPALYNIYLQAKHAVHTSFSGPEPIELLKYVIEQDPNYFPAMNLLGLTYYFGTGNSATDLFTPEIGYALSDEMHRRAFEIDPDDAETNAYRAWKILQAKGDLAAATSAAEKAFQAEPGNAEVLRLLAAFARTIGKFDTAVELAEMSVARDPVCPSCFYVLSTAYMMAGKYARAERTLRKRMTLAPGGWHGLGDSLLARGEPQAALDAYNQQQDQVNYWLLSTAKALYSLGRTAEYQDNVKRALAGGDETGPLQLAALYAWTGDIDNAFAWLDKAIESGIRQVDAAQWDFHFKSLRDDPRWNAFWDEHWFTEEEFAAVEFNIP